MGPAAVHHVSRRGAQLRRIFSMSSRLYVNVDCVEHREISYHPSSSSSFLSLSLRLEPYCKTDVSRWASIMVIRRRVEWERNTSSRFDAHDVHRRAGEGQRAWGSVARPCGLIAAGRWVREASCEGDWYNMMYHMRQSAPADMPDVHVCHVPVCRSCRARKGYSGHCIAGRWRWEESPSPASRRSSGCVHAAYGPSRRR